MSSNVQRITPAFLGILVALLAAVLFYPEASQAAPVMTTDKADYYAAETVTVTGTGFAPNTTYDVPVVRPDGSIVKGNGTLTPGWDTVTSNGSGSFTYLYKLDGIFGAYEVRAYPSPWSGNLAEGPLTTVTFTDADIHFSQCSNDDNNDDTAEPCKWVEGGLNQNNSIFTEGDAVPQRLFHKLTDVGAYQFEFEYDFSKSSIYAYDFLTSADQGPQNTLALLNPCADAPAFAGACSTITNSLYTGSSTVAIPSDPFDSVPGAEAAVATRDFRVACSGPGACSAVAVFFPSGNGVDDPGENHVPDVDPADCHNATATKCGTMSVKIRLSVTTPAGTSNSSPTLVAAWFGGHLSLESYWGMTCGTGGTDRCGASSISGAPFHLKYNCLDEPDSPDGGCESVGSRDNQISPGAVTKGNITITKDVVTQSGTHPQDFGFSCTPMLGSFTLDDDGASGNPLNSSQAFIGVPAASYTCTESAPASGWSLTSLVCNDPSGGTTVNLATRTATIDLDNGESITCTYTNTATGTINIIKDAVPNDAQDFAFTCTGGLGSFSLDDDADGTLSNTKTFGAPTPPLAGSYMCTESIPIMPWSLSSISCSDPDGGTTTNVGTLTATIDLDPGETITCTFTNDKGSVTIVKDAVPNDAQNFAFSGTCFGSFSLDDDADVTLSNTKAGNVGIGSCTVTEGAPAAGWTLTSIVCSDPDNGTTVNLLTRTATIDVDAGESITCTFTNTGMGTIVISKTCDPPADPQSFTFTRSYGPNVNVGCGGTNSTDLSPGTYSVSEAVPAGWDLTSSTCSDGSAPGSISLQAGETVTCTFNNEKDANIIVCKETDPNGDPQSFTFTPSYGANFSLTDGLCNDSGDLAPGAYSVSEAAPGPDWVLFSSSCSDGSTVASISLSAGETITCTFNNTKTGSITIVKDAIPNGTQGFFFTCSAPIGPFTLDDDGTNGNPFDSSKTTGGLLPGTYNCSEALPAGWVLTSATCSDGSIPASISLSAGENVTCTFVNTQPGSITIIKDAVPNNGQDFNFSCSAPIGAFALDDDGTNGNPLDSSKTESGLLPGNYSCSEAVPTGWALSGISCAGDTDSGSVVALPGVTIDLDAGENITCTFANTQGSITIIKDTVPNGPQDFCFNGALPDVNGADPGDFCLDDDGDGTLSNSHSVSVAPGTYVVNELGPTSGFQLTALTCSDPDNGTSVDLLTSTATIDLDAGESVTCTFTNTAAGRIIISKVCDPPSDPQLFTFSRGYGANVNVGCGGSNVSNNLTPGTYSVAEATPAGWVLSGAICNDGSSPGAILVDPGEIVTCTFTNVKNGNVVINKTCVGGNDTFGYTGSGSGIAANFNITCVGGSGSQAFNNIAPGPKTVTESSLPAGWALTMLVCVDPDNGSSPGGATANIDLDAGETVTCTYTNAKSGSITIVKDAVPNDPQDFSFTCSAPLGSFQLDDDGANGNPLDSSKGPVNVAAGTYNCSEAAVSSWTTSATCSDGSPVGLINVSPGENVICTFVNTKDGSITIVKDVANPPGTHSQDFSFTCSAPLGSFLLDDDADGTLSNTKGPVAVAPGIYNCSEAAVSSWTTSATCSDGSPASAINVGPGENVTCTFVNTKQGSITIVKDVANPPGTDPTDFNFTCSAPLGSFQLDDDGANGNPLDSSKGPVGVSPGTYSCSETALAGWQSVGSCSDASPVSAIAVAAGEDVTCTFTNTPVGNVVIMKTCVGGNNTFAYTGTLGGFNLTCVSGSASQAFNNIPVGTKTVTESPPPSAWSFTSLVCIDPDSGTATSAETTTIDLDAGETVTCIYTNTMKATVVIVKDTVPDAPQDFSFACGGLGAFTLDDDADGTLPNSYVFTNVAPGSYTCTESNAVSYQITVSCADPDSGSSGSPPNALMDVDPGETITCTFTNTFQPGDNPVGGIVGLIDDDGSHRPDQAAGSDGGKGWTLGALAAAMALVLAGVWVTRRRLFG